MKRYLLILLPSLIVFLVNTPVSSAATSQNACIECHTFMGGQLGEPVSKWMGSIHQTEGVNCDVCHGGNADVKVGDLKQLSNSQFSSIAKQAMYAASDFVGAPSGQAQFNLCANCHPDVVKTYSASIMGQAFLKAKGGPACTRCHGAHRNAIPSVPEVCKGCHKDTTGFDKLPPMNITAVQVQKLAHIRIQVGEKKISGRGPLFTGHVESIETGVVVWGMVFLLFLVSVGLHLVMKVRGKP